jgi:DNA-binding transcriptional LysR family regulator
VDLQHLKAFVLLAQELHFARAADVLDIAQPVLSRRIQELEKYLDTPLFLRTTRSVSLTAAGLAFVDPAREVLESVDRAVHIARKAGAGEIGRVSIAFAGASTHVLVGRLSQVVHAELPGITLQLTSAQFAQPALDRVLKRETDIAFGRWEHLPAGVNVRTIAVENLVVAVPSAHPLALHESVSIAQLRDEPMVALPREFGSVLNKRLRRMASEEGFVPSIIQEAPDSWTLISLVAAGIGCTLTLSTVQENFTPEGVRFLPLREETTPIYLRMAWLSDSTNPALESVLRIADHVLPSAPHQLSAQQLT